MFKGVTLELGDNQYIIPPLSLEKLEELEDRFRTLGTPALNFSERLKQLMPILLASFQRNYPEMTEAELRRQLDLPALNHLMQIITEANGFKAVWQGDGVGPGSAEAEQGRSCLGREMGEAYPSTPKPRVPGAPVAVPADP